MTIDHQLLAEAGKLCNEPRLKELLCYQAGWPYVSSSRLYLHIHPDDQMLLHSLRHHHDASAAVSQYFNVSLQQYKTVRQVLDLLWPWQAQPLSVLDFACGFGRLIRLLCHDPRPLEIHVSEIQPDALDFVANTFSVSPIKSSYTPEAFAPTERFDMIWVASLFSHLPKHLFERWLTRLCSLLKPGGALCFTVHDAHLAPPSMSLSSEGLLFLSESENNLLDSSAYGTTYVSEAFVRRTVATQCDQRAAMRRLPKALAHEQDLYILVPQGALDLTRLAQFRRGPWGWVDERRLDGGHLVLRGWAASIDDGVLPEVVIRVNDHFHRCPTGLPRPDVAAVFADPRLLAAGWYFRIPIDRTRPPWVEVTAHSDRDESSLLYSGWPR